jgi:hypothetical protein
LGGVWKCIPSRTDRKEHLELSFSYECPPPRKNLYPIRLRKLNKYSFFVKGKGAWGRLLSEDFGRHSKRVKRGKRALGL